MLRQILCVTPFFFAVACGGVEGLEDQEGALGLPPPPPPLAQQCDALFAHLRDMPATGANALGVFTYEDGAKKILGITHVVKEITPTRFEAMGVGGTLDIYNWPAVEGQNREVKMTVFKSATYPSTLLLPKVTFELFNGSTLATVFTTTQLIDECEVVGDMATLEMHNGTASLRVSFL